MDQHDSPSGFVPDAYDRLGRPTKANAISPLRSRWRVPAVATSLTVVAALCLYAGSANHASAADSAAKPASNLVVRSAVNTGSSASLKGHFEAAATAPSGGIHGALNMYEGPGGGIEFWFNPGTGDLTVAVSVGVGEGGSGVLGSYVGAPEPGTYLYATADFAAGSVATVNLLGNYSFTNGVFAGQVSTTIMGRTVTISSDGSSTFDASVYAAEGAAGFTGAAGVQFVYSFNVLDVIEYIWDQIKDLLTGDYSLIDSDDTGDETVAYEDDSSTDGTDLSTDDSSDDSSGSDASSDDASSDDSASDSGDDSSDGGSGGDEDSSPIESSDSLLLVQHADLR